MHAYAAAGAAFLLAVLWFDLMFDVQTAGTGGSTLPPEILMSISAYYRRVTTAARPMNNIVSLVMLLTLVAIASEVPGKDHSAWICVPSLLLAASAIALALLRTVRNARALGKREGSPQAQSNLARKVFYDHLYCLVAMTAVLTLQLAAH
jgi:hypothetical protein